MKIHKKKKKKKKKSNEDLKNFVRTASSKCTGKKVQF